jgi:hypothetical protein
MNLQNNKTWNWSAAILTMIIAILYFWDFTPKERWIDEALSYNGQIIPVDRTVEFVYGGGELSNAAHRWPSKYSLKFKNPENGKTISWSGENHVNPILVDIVNGTPWLVVNANNLQSNIELYGCSETAFAFLKFDGNAKKWKPVPAKDAPIELQNANLSYDWEAYLMQDKRTQTSAEISEMHHSKEISTSYHFSKIIPRELAQWKYKSKKQLATSRVRNDCRPPLDKPVDFIASIDASSPPVSVNLEILETKNFEPEWIMKEDRNASISKWSQFSWDKDRVLECNNYTRYVDQENAQLVSWRVFKSDPTGQRMYSPQYLPLCDSDAIWFFKYNHIGGRISIIKTTTNGEILYHTSFIKPIYSGAYGGSILMPTFRAQEGFIYFDWCDSEQHGYDRHIKRTLKVRFPEPSSKPLQSQAGVSK